jgi:hypothetical protein
MERYKLIKLFVDEQVDKPLEVIQSYLAHIGVQAAEDASYFYDVAPSIISSYGGRPIQDAVAFYVSHMMKIAQSKNLKVDTLDFRSMMVSEFTIPANGCKGILLAIPVPKN